MPQSPKTGICILTIDLATAERAAHPSPQTSATGLERLRDRLSAAAIPLTWGVDRLQAAVGRYLLVRPMLSEVALLADTSWTAAGVNRRRFAAGFIEGLNAFRSAGLSPTTLLLPNWNIAPHDDLLVKQGIQIVRVDAAAACKRDGARQRPASSGASAGAWRSARWGLWEAPVTIRVAANTVRAVERALDHLRRQGGSVILAAHAALLCENERLLNRLIAQLTGAREGSVRLETLAAAVENLRASRRPSSARSILHPAA